MIQGGVLGIQEEEKGLDKVLRAARDMATSKAEGHAPHGVMVDLTSGYFGLYRKYKESLLQSQAPYRVVAASPEVSIRRLRLDMGGSSLSFPSQGQRVLQI